MSDTVLVTYASRAGSTVGVAEAIAKTLAERGIPVELHPMEDVHNLAPYRAVVAGSAIRGNEWLPEAIQFVQTHQSELKRKPFATFMVCMTLSMANADKYRDSVKKWMAPVRVLVRPVSEGYFAGALDFSRLPRRFSTLMLRIPVLLGMWKAGDHRDWDAICDWAGELPALLRENS